MIVCGRRRNDGKKWKLKRENDDNLVDVDGAPKLPLQPLDLTRRSGSVGSVRLNCQGCKAAGDNPLQGSTLQWKLLRIARYP